MGRFVVLLRGINVGGNRPLKMAALRDMLEAAGYSDVRTHLQSGNVVLTARSTAPRVAKDVERRIASEFAVDPEVLVRTRAELGAVVELDPLRDVATDPARYLVTFLSERPDRGVVRGLAEIDLPPERFALHGKELYSWHPDGLQRSRLLRVLTERRLGVRSTSRNWRTVTKLLELAAA
jgi:uncharacterized protein (DUF1697 family)